MGKMIHYFDWALSGKAIAWVYQLDTNPECERILQSLGYRKIEGDEVLIGVLESLSDRLDADKDLAEIKALGYVIKWYKGER